MGLARLGAKAIEKAIGKAVAEKKEKKKLSDNARGIVYMEDIPDREKEAYLALGESYWDYNKWVFSGNSMQAADAGNIVKRERLQLLADVFMAVHNQAPDQAGRIIREMELVLNEIVVRKDIKLLTEGQEQSKPDNGNFGDEPAVVSQKVYRQMKPEAADFTFDPEKLQKYAMIFKVIETFSLKKMRDMWCRRSSLRQKEIFNFLADYVIASEGLDPSKKDAFIEKLKRSFYDSNLVKVEELIENKKKKELQLTNFASIDVQLRFANDYLEQLRQMILRGNKDFSLVQAKAIKQILHYIERETDRSGRKSFDLISREEQEKKLMETVNGETMKDIKNWNPHARELAEIGREKMMSKKNEICSIYVKDLWGERFEKLVPEIVESELQMKDIVAGAGTVLKEKYNLPDDYVELILARLKHFLTAQYVRGINFEKVAQKELNEDESRKLVSSIYRSLDEIFSAAEEYAGGFMADKKAELKRYYVLMLQSGIRIALEAIFRTMISPYSGSQIAKLQKELDEHPEEGQRAGEIKMEIKAIREGHYEALRFIRENDPVKLKGRIKKLFSAYGCEDLFEPFWAELTGFMGQGKSIQYLIPKDSPWRDVLFKRR